MPDYLKYMYITVFKVLLKVIGQPDKTHSLTNQLTPTIAYSRTHVLY